MKCDDCVYDKNCSLKEIAKDITGCEGHSKERLPNEYEVKCSCCKRWSKSKEVFTSKIDKYQHICFKCY